MDGEETLSELFLKNEIKNINNEIQKLNKKKYEIHLNI